MDPPQSPAPPEGIPDDDRIFPNVFVTVGTTSFDCLITWAQDQETTKQFKNLGVQGVKLQIGSSKLYNEGTRTFGNIPYEFYSYKSNLSEDYEWADLIIGHAGAGTVLDVLDRGKTLFVIPNESLMDNHQIELGEFIQSECYGYSSSLDKAHSMMSRIRRGGIQKFPSRNIQGFLEGVEETMNFDPIELMLAKSRDRRT